MIIDDLDAIAEAERSSGKKIVIRCCMAAGCMSSHSEAVKTALEKVIRDSGLSDRIEVRGVGCMRLCCQGPLVGIDPEGVIYEKVTPEDAPALVISTQGGEAEGQEGRPEPPLLHEAALRGARQQRADRPRADRVLHRGRRLPGAARRAARDDAQRRGRECDQERAAGARGRGIFHRPEVGHGGQDARHPEIRGLQRGRGRPRRVHGPQRPRKRPAQRPRGHGHRRLCRRREPGLHLRPRGVPARHQAAADRHQAGEADRPPRQRHLRVAVQLHDRHPHRSRGVRLRRGDGAHGLDRGQARDAAPPAAVSRGKRALGLPDPDQQRGDLRQHPARSSARGPNGSPPSGPDSARGPRCSPWRAR